MPHAVRLTAAATAVVLAGATAVPVLGGAQTPPAGRQTITFQETTPKIAIDDLAPTSRSNLSLGDRLVIGGPLFDAARKRVGRFGSTCTVVATGSSFPTTPLLCTGAYDTADGQILVSGITTLAKLRLAITGGTGSYAGATGNVTSEVKPAKGFDDADVLTIDHA